MDLSIIEVKLAQWIQSIYHDPSVAPATLEQMRRMNDEIVRMANHIIQIDEHAQREFDDIKKRTRAKSSISLRAPFTHHAASNIRYRGID